ncbi:MAG: transcription-repair coupling factor, partial [Xanthomonadales bacterium]|nr:transcription-repair coupling factor [Xanthomonadales bacterium]
MGLSPLKARFSDGPGTASAPQRWTGLHSSALALALHEAASQASRPVLAITRSSHQAHLLARDLELLKRGDLPTRLFPDNETLPYDPFSPHPDIIAERIRTLADIVTWRCGVVVVSAAALMQRLPPSEYLKARSFSLSVGDRLVVDAFRQRLAHCGYEPAEQVYQAGQFAVRGSVIDLFPAGSDAPFRLDLFDEDIDTIRTFDPESQRSTGQVDAIEMLPAREYPFDAEAVQAFRQAFRRRFDVDVRHVTLYQDLRNGAHPQGLEQYLPLFFESTSGLTEFFSEPALYFVQRGAREAVEAQHRRTGERWEQRRHDTERPLLEPAELFFEPEHFDRCLQDQHQVWWEKDGDDQDPPGTAPRGAEVIAFDTQPAPELPIHEKGKAGGDTLKAFCESFDGRVLFAADTPGRREVLRSTLDAFGVHPLPQDSFETFWQGSAHEGLCVLPVDGGFLIPGELALITESQLFGGRTRPRAERARADRDPEAIIRDLTDLAPGAPVVHQDHGVGRYLGLEILSIDDREAEFLMLEYADGDKLYVPVSSLHLVSRYTGSSPESAPLHRLGSQQWEKAKKRAARQVRDVAAELLELHARRHARPGISYPLDPRLYAEFVSGFPYEETGDQERAIEAVIGDMVEGRPMDRVVCGDVGFGKTEVALRAAFIAVQAGRQVALLVPTTLLAQQHFNSFSDRFADWPVQIELLSRFRSARETSDALARIASGGVDIVIGTHRLLSRDIRFKNLGLVIVDEEQRFGVRQKERLKALRSEVDLLTLTATPIPRTLNMAMSGVRDLSIIATPPARRMAVKTLITPWDKGVLREALQREIQRGGQVFFLHNEVRSIQRIAREVEALVPSARMAIAHGQLPERELERVMLDFYRQRFNVLVCTTIIENGIDVPTANTIIINRADHLGLAQLHQLRGRVGRSHHRAYAYLITPHR